jgi:hypothetical protein
MKNKIIDNPFDQEELQDLLDNHLLDKRYLGKQQANYVQKFDREGQLILNSGILGEVDAGEFEFEFFRSNANVLHHTDSIPGNIGEYGIIIPLQWEGHDPATIMYNWFTERRVQYAGNNQIAYCDTDEIVDLDLDSLEESLVFEWDKDKALIFDVVQLHSARRFKEGWKEFIIGFEL